MDIDKINSLKRVIGSQRAQQALQGSSTLKGWRALLVDLQTGDREAETVTGSRIRQTWRLSFLVTGACNCEQTISLIVGRETGGYAKELIDVETKLNRHFCRTAKLTRQALTCELEDVKDGHNLGLRRFSMATALVAEAITSCHAFMWASQPGALTECGTCPQQLACLAGGKS